MLTDLLFSNFWPILMTLFRILTTIVQSPRCILFCFRFIMPLIEEIVSHSCSSLEEEIESSVSVPGNAERLEIQSDGVNLCFIQKNGVETEDEGFISDMSSSSNGGMCILGKESSYQHQSHMPVIQEINSQDVADSCSEFLACDNAYNAPEPDLITSHSVNGHVNLMKGEEDCQDNSMCKFCASM